MKKEAESRDKGLAEADEMDKQEEEDQKGWEEYMQREYGSEWEGFKPEPWAIEKAKLFTEQVIDNVCVWSF